jgi:DNA polymerase III epsilon subunit-like protein
MKGKTVVGTEVKNDLTSLGLTTEELETDTVEDIQKYYVDTRNQKISLKQLGKHFYGYDRSNLHSAVVDARITMMCYIRMKRLLLHRPDNLTFKCPLFDQERNEPKTRSIQKWEICKCDFQKRTKKKTHVFDQLGSLGKIHPSIFHDVENWDFGGLGNASNMDDNWE